MQLTNNQKKFLRTLAHNIHPVIMIGNNGFSESVKNELLITLEKHELLKIKIRLDKQEKQEAIDSILQLTNAHLVQVIGGVVVIYLPFEEEPQIVLPKK